MKLLTKAILKQVPTMAQTAHLSISEQFVYCKFFNPCGGETWYMTAYDPEERIAFGFVNLGDPEMAELGTFSMEEIENIRGKFGLEIERDRSFTKKPLKEVMDIVKKGGHI